MRKQFLISLVIVTMGVVGAMAGLSPDRQAWRKGPVQFLMTSDEITKWNAVQTDADADAFVASFWERRDPTPGTPKNEFKETFDARVKFADLHYTFGKTHGSMTPRGKAIILLGAPYSVRREGDVIGSDVVAGAVIQTSGGKITDPTTGAQVQLPGPARTPSPNGGAGGSVNDGFTSAADMNDNPEYSDSGQTTPNRRIPSETWVYEHDRSLNFTDQKTVTLVFVDQDSLGDYRLGRSPDTNPTAIFQAAVKAAVAPGKVIVGEPQYHIGDVTGAAVGDVADSSLHTPALLDVVARMHAATELPYNGVYLSWGEFVTSTGESFVPVQLYLTRFPTLPARPATFFGTVFDQNGAQVASYERPVKLDVSGAALVADTSLSLPPGKYSGLFGVAVDGNPLAMARGALEVKGLDKAAPGVSHLILSDDIHPMATAQQPTDPFSFGGAKVVVKGDRLFSQKSDLWFFVELRNPGIDQAGSPKVRMQIDVEGTSGNQPVKFSVPLQDTHVDPLKGVAGHFALGQSIPLAKIPPGNYTMKVRLVDVLRQTTYDLTDRFSVLPGA